MIKLTQSTKVGSDCTSGFNISLDKEYTVKEFIEEVLTKKEWGSINVSGMGSCEYKGNVLIKEMPEELLDIKVKKATSVGGWSNMNYYINQKG